MPRFLRVVEQVARIDHRVEGGIVEDRHRLPRDAGAIHHPMRVGAEAVIRPAMHQVADIDHEGAGDRMRGDPLPAAIQHLQPTGHVLVEESQPAIIGMRCDAELVLAHLRRLRRVPDQRPAGERLGEAAFEEVSVPPEAQRQAAKHALAERKDMLVIAIGGLTQGWEGGGPVVRAHQRRSGRDVRVAIRQFEAPDEALLQIHLGGGLLPRPATADPAAMQAIDLRLRLLRVGQGEEVARAAEDLVYRGLRHAVVGDVEEADPLAGFAHCPAGGSAAGGVAGHQRADIQDGNLAEFDLPCRRIGHGRSLRRASSRGMARGGSVGMPCHARWRSGWDPTSRCGATDELLLTRISCA